MYSYLKERLNRIDNHTLLLFEGRKIKASSFLSDVDAVAAGLRAQGIGKGDVVCTNLPNTINAIVLFYAVNKCGAIANIVHPLVPVETLAKTATETNAKLIFVMDFFYVEHKDILEASGIKVVICKVSDYLPLYKSLIYRFKEKKIPSGILTFKSLKKKGGFAPVMPEVAAYLHSGGTTGKAKTIMLSDSSFNNLATSLVQCVDEESRDPNKNRSLMVLPLFHGFGLGVCMHTLLSQGFETTIMIRFNAKRAAELIEKRQITYIAGVPLMYKKFLDLDDEHFAKLKSLRNLFCGGDKLTADLKSAFDARFKKFGGKSELQEGYGLTETVTVCTLNKRGDWSQGSMGYGIEGITLGIVDENNNVAYENAEGEICVAGGTLMAGYLNAPNDNMFGFDGKRFVKTGDWGHLDENGKLFLTDRIKRIFKVSGVNVFPSEIEETVRSLPFVYECVAIYKEETKSLRVCVSLNKDVKISEEDAIRGIIEECKRKLISYSVPGSVKVYASLPKTAVGKLDVGKLNADF